VAERGRNLNRRFLAVLDRNESNIGHFLAELDRTWNEHQWALSGVLPQGGYYEVAKFMFTILDLRLFIQMGLAVPWALARR
jgi:hypothetical protein